MPAWTRVALAGPLRPWKSQACQGSRITQDELEGASLICFTSHHLVAFYMNTPHVWNVRGQNPPRMNSSVSSKSGSDPGARTLFFEWPATLTLRVAVDLRNPPLYHGLCDRLCALRPRTYSTPPCSTCERSDLAIRRRSYVHPSHRHADFLERGLEPGGAAV